MSGRTLVIGLCAVGAAILSGRQVARTLGANACLDAGGAFGAPRNCEFVSGTHWTRTQDEARPAWLTVGLVSVLAAVGTVAIGRLVPRR